MSEDTTVVTDTPPAGGQFDLSAMPPEQQAGLQAYIEQQKQGVLKKNQELLDKFTNLKSERDQLSTKAGEIDEAFQGRTLDEVKETLSSIDQANIDQLMKDGKIKEAFELRTNAEMSRLQKQHDAALKTSQDESLSKDDRLATLTRKVERMTIGKVASNFFLETDNALNSPAVLNDVEEKALALFQLGEDGEPVAMRNSEPVLDSKGSPLSLKTWVNEELRSSHSHYWEKITGANAKGGAAGSANGYGTGITSRKGASASDMAAFMKAFREKNPQGDASKAWLEMPDA